MCDCDAFEERREAMEPQPLGDVMNVRRSIAWRHGGDAAEVGERRAGAAAPGHTVQPLAGTAHRQPVADNAEREIVADDVRAGEKDESGGQNQSDRVHDEPQLMTIVVALQHAVNQGLHLVERHVVGMERQRLRLAPQVPQQPLLGDALHDPREDTILHAREKTFVLRRRVGLVPVLPLFGGTQHRRKTMAEPSDDARGRRLLTDVVVGRHFAIELVPIDTDGHNVDVHVISNRRYTEWPEAARYNRGMRVVMMALLLAVSAQSPAVVAEFRVFAGHEEITANTRLRVMPTGKRESATTVAQGPRPSTTLAPGIYDVQVFRLKQDAVVGIRWAERLVIMQYPDEGGRHLEVINFEPGYGALQVRTTRGDLATYEVTAFAAGNRTVSATSPIRGDDYVLFVLRAGQYDIRVRHASGAEDPEATHWILDVEVPADRTRMKQIDLANP